MITVEQGSYLEIAGLRTFYVQRGTGVPLVMIHGGAPGGCALVNWGPTIEPLAQAGLAVYTFDQPGFGNTDNPGDYSLEFRLRHAQAFVEAMGLGEYNVMGNSQGAYVAARIALEDPRVQRLVLVSSGTLSPPGSTEAQALSKAHAEELRQYEPSLENMRAMTLKTLYDKSLVTDELVRLRYEMSIGKNQEAQEGRAGAKAPPPLFDRLSDLSLPTLIITGKNDRGVALERSVLLCQQIPNAELHIFPNCGHWAQWDQARRFNEQVASFLLPVV